MTCSREAYVIVVSSRCHRSRKDCSRPLETLSETPRREHPNVLGHRSQATADREARSSQL